MGGETCSRQNKYVWFSYVKSKNEKLLGLLANLIWQQVLDPQNNLKTVDLLYINGSSHNNNKKILSYYYAKF